MNRERIFAESDSGNEERVRFRVFRRDDGDLDFEIEWTFYGENASTDGDVRFTMDRTRAESIAKAILGIPRPGGDHRWIGALGDSLDHT